MNLANNRDIKQILLFKNNSLRHRIDIYGWKEVKNGCSPEKAYLSLTARGIKTGSVNDIKKLKFLLNCKKNRDTAKKEWTYMLRNGLSYYQELIEKDIFLFGKIREGITKKICYFLFPKWRAMHESLVNDCMKDIIKTTSRLDEFERIGFPISSIAAGNRNWFMDKLNIKLPNDSCDCYVCQESYWKSGKYVKITRQ